MREHARPAGLTRRSGTEGGWGALAVVTLGVVILTTGPLYRVRSWWEYDNPLATDVSVVGVQACVVVAAVLVLASRGRWRLVDKRAGLLALALSAWLLLGTAWSLDASTTSRESLQIAGTLAAGAAAATVLPPRRLLWCGWVGVHIGLAWSAAAVATVQPGTQDRNGDWAGVFFNRNSLALYAALGILLSILIAAGAGRSAAIHGWRVGRDEAVVLAVLGAAALADVVLVAGSDALTPLLALGAALGAGIAGRAGQRLVRNGFSAERLAAITGAAVLAVGSAGWMLRERLVELAGRDADLTGRSELWSVALDWSWRRPLTGFGYLARLARPRVPR